MECMSYEPHIDIMMYLKRCDFGGFEVVKDRTSDGKLGNMSPNIEFASNFAA